MAHVFWIVPLVLLIAFLGSPRFRGDIAETRVRRILAAALEKRRYTILNDITIPAGGGSVHIDHIVVSRSGIFVIDSQYARGWVSGEEFQDRWKQYHWRRFTRLDNPLHRNRLQVEALEGLLSFPAKTFHPVVVLAGQKGFKTKMPDRVLQPEKLVAYVRKKAQPLLDAEQAGRALKTILDARIPQTDIMRFSRWRLLQAVLIIALFAGIYLAFGEEFKQLGHALRDQQENRAKPELFHPDGSRKSAREIWEDSLTCAYSQDTGRCACYEPGGQKADLDSAQCRSLAERGSILKQ